MNFFRAGLPGWPGRFFRKGGITEKGFKKVELQVALCFVKVRKEFVFEE